VDKTLLAILAAMVTVCGWYATYYFTKKREDETRRLESRIGFLQRQIEEFYGPLFSLTNRVLIFGTVQHNIEASGQTRLNDHERDRIRVYIRDNYFRPMHDQINAIITSKLYLIEGEIPSSLYTYWLHVAQERIQQELWEQLKISTHFLEGAPFPRSLLNDLKTGLEDRRFQYNEALKALNPTRAE